MAPDPPLKAVTARNYEVGMDARPFTWLDVHATVYRTDLSDDIFSIDPVKIRDVKVLKTIVGGKVVWEAYPQGGHSQGGPSK